MTSSSSSSFAKVANFSIQGAGVACFRAAAAKTPIQERPTIIILKEKTCIRHSIGNSDLSAKTQNSNSFYCPELQTTETSKHHTSSTKQQHCQSTLRHSSDCLDLCLFVSLKIKKRFKGAAYDLQYWQLPRYSCTLLSKGQFVFMKAILFSPTLFHPVLFFILVKRNVTVWARTSRACTIIERGKLGDASLVEEEDASQHLKLGSLDIDSCKLRVHPSINLG